MNECGFRSDSSGRLQRSPIPGDETDADMSLNFWQFTEYTMTCAEEGRKTQPPPGGTTHGRDKNFDMAARCWDSLNLTCEKCYSTATHRFVDLVRLEKKAHEWVVVIRGGVHPFVIRPSRDRCKFVGASDLHSLPQETEPR